MKRNVDMKDISDGRLYTSGDMVKADTGGCTGCSECCRGMGSSIILDPYDGYRLCMALQAPFETLLDKNVELNVVDGIILPNLLMAGEGEECTFLENGRCRIHPARPGICRLFPLGRYYEGQDFRYFLQIHECPRAGGAKVKIRKWIDLPGLPRYEEYIRRWHYFLEAAGHILDADSGDQLRKSVNLYLLRQFYFLAWDPERDFYEQFEQRLAAGKKYVGLIA